MRVFDSNKNKRWQGTGFASRDDLLTILKNAKFHQQISLEAGIYILRSIGRRKIGGGAVIIEIIDKNDLLINSFYLEFASANWSEQVFSFKISQPLDNLKIKISRDEKSIGTIEISRLSIDIKKASNEVLSNYSNQNTAAVEVENELETLYTGDTSTKPHIGYRRITQLRPATIASVKKEIEKENIKKNDKNKTLDQKKEEKNKIAFIISGKNFGENEIYIKNIIEHYPKNIDISLLYIEADASKYKIFENKFKNIFLESPHLLIENIENNNYNYIVFYDRVDIYTLLTSLVSRGDIKSKLIELYFGNDNIEGLRTLKSRSNIHKLITISPSLAINIDGIGLEKREVITPGVNVDLFSFKDSKAIKKSFGLENKKIIGTYTNFNNYENIDKIILLAKELSEYIFMVVGEGPNKDCITQIIYNDKIKNVNIPSDTQKINEFYNLFDAYISLSDNQDNPIYIIQAMSSGIPVFTKEVGIVNDMIKDTITGFIISEDIDLAAEKIRKNINDKEVIKNARRYVEKSYNSKINSSEFFDFFFK